MLQMGQESDCTIMHESFKFLKQSFSAHWTATWLNFCPQRLLISKATLMGLHGPPHYLQKETV